MQQSKILGRWLTNLSFPVFLSVQNVYAGPAASPEVLEAEPKQQHQLNVLIRHFQGPSLQNFFAVGTNGASLDECFHQCDQMARSFVPYLAIYND